MKKLIKLFFVFFMSILFVGTVNAEMTANDKITLSGFLSSSKDYVEITVYNVTKRMTNGKYTMAVNDKATPIEDYDLVADLSLLDIEIPYEPDDEGKLPMSTEAKLRLPIPEGYKKKNTVIKAYGNEYEADTYSVGFAYFYIDLLKNEKDDKYSFNGTVYFDLEEYDTIIDEVRIENPNIKYEIRKDGIFYESIYKLNVKPGTKPFDEANNDSIFKATVASRDKGKYNVSYEMLEEFEPYEECEKYDWCYTEYAATGRVVYSVEEMNEHLEEGQTLITELVKGNRYKYSIGLKTIGDDFTFEWGSGPLLNYNNDENIKANSSGVEGMMQHFPKTWYVLERNLVLDEDEEETKDPEEEKNPEDCNTGDNKDPEDSDDKEDEKDPEDTTPVPVVTKDISVAKVKNANLKPVIGELPKFTAESDEKDLYTIEFERWCDSKTKKCYSSSDYYNRDNILEKIEEGHTYYYSIALKANDPNYENKFTANFLENVKLSLNGEEYTVDSTEVFGADSKWGIDENYLVFFYDVLEYTASEDSEIEEPEETPEEKPEEKPEDKPATPENPSVPSEPSKPSEPENPSTPSEPSTPEKPEQKPEQKPEVPSESSEETTVVVPEISDSTEVSDVVIGVTDVKDTQNVILESLKKNNKYKDMENISVVVDITTEEKNVNKEEAAAIQEKANKMNLVVGKFFDITLNVVDITNNNVVGTLPELSKAIKLQVALPKEYKNVPKGYKRVYYVVRNHNGELEILSATLNTEEMIEFESDKYSTYAIAYEDVLDDVATTPTTPTTPANPNTYDGIEMYVTFASLSLIGLLTTYNLRKEN